MTPSDMKMTKQMASYEVVHAAYAATFSPLRQRLAQSLLAAPSGQTVAGAAGTGKSLSIRALMRVQGARLGGRVPGELAQGDDTASELAPHRDGEHT